MFHILVVDDAVVSLNAVKNCLQDSYKLTLVRSGREAVNALTKTKIDVILLDYDMPQMDGVETLKLIRKLDCAKNLPVFFLTGHSDKATVMKCLEAGIDGYLVKPVNKELIEKRLENVLN